MKIDYLFLFICIYDPKITFLQCFCEQNRCLYISFNEYQLPLCIISCFVSVFSPDPFTHLRPFRCFHDPSGPFWIFSNPYGPLIPFRTFLDPSWSLQPFSTPSHLDPSWPFPTTIPDSSQPFLTFLDHFWPFQPFPIVAKNEAQLAIWWTVILWKGVENDFSPGNLGFKD